VNSKTFLEAIALCLSIGAASCSAGAPGTAGGEDPGRGAQSVPPGDMGSVGMTLTLPGGASIAVVDWAIAGPNGAATVVQSGMVDVHESGGASFQVTNIPAASGYRVVVSAASTDGGVSCEGSATFAVMSRATTHVSVQMACNSASAGGQTTLVNGTSFDCAAWSDVTASPVETRVGSSVALAVTATGPIPANLTYAWSAPTGQFSAATAANTNFTCTAAGPVTVTIVVGDGAVPEGSTCNPALDTDTVTVTCTGSAPPPPAAPALPPWALFAFVAGAMGLGVRASRRFTPLD
jgi:hypothetical protein